MGLFRMVSSSRTAPGKGSSQVSAGARAADQRGQVRLGCSIFFQSATSTCSSQAVPFPYICASRLGIIIYYRRHLCFPRKINIPSPQISSILAYLIAVYIIICLSVFPIIMFISSSQHQQQLHDISIMQTMSAGYFSHYEKPNKVQLHHPCPTIYKH